MYMASLVLESCFKVRIPISPRVYFLYARISGADNSGRQTASKYNECQISYKKCDVIEQMATLCNANCVDASGQPENYALSDSWISALHRYAQCPGSCRTSVFDGETSVLFKAWESEDRFGDFTLFDEPAAYREQVRRNL
jgi:hypothetical protein